MLFKILGPLEVSEDGEVLPLAGPKQQTLLAVLLLHPNEPLSRERLIDELWGDAPPPTAAHNLHVYVSHLRKLLTAKGAAPAATLTTRSRGYALEVEPDQLDLHEFQRLMQCSQLNLSSMCGRSNQECRAKGWKAGSTAIR